ncbi:hypothetical protein COCOBI_08-4980 [Coccomyxa sp. Obi]|nr:hypothetical protein COCOBI_08-4980 [Coccomyxa sp. Obi]
MYRKFRRTPEPVEEPLLEEAAREEAEELVKDLSKVWGDFRALLPVIAKDEAIMRPTARAAGFDLKHFNFDPAEHPDLRPDLKDFLNVLNNALDLKNQLIIMLVRREQLKVRLARTGSKKTSEVLQPQSRQFEIFAKRQKQRFKELFEEGSS